MVFLDFFAIKEIFYLTLLQKNPAIKDWIAGHTERKRSASYRNEMEMLHIVEL